MKRGFQKSHSVKHVLSTGAESVVTLIIVSQSDSEREGPRPNGFITTR